MTSKKPQKTLNSHKVNAFKPKLIIGLGNPGSEYKKTYHNAGFLFIDWLASSKNLNFKNSPSKKFQFSKLGGVVISKTNIFMNKSGAAVNEAKKIFEVPAESLLIVHDDSDLELGKYKLSFSRGSGGHNGVSSIIKSLKTKNFWRLRLGIRKQEPAKSLSAQRKKAGDFVLKSINPQDQKKLQFVFNEIIEKVMENINP